MISEVAEEEREALEAKVVEKSTESMRPVFWEQHCRLLKQYLAFQDTYIGDLVTESVS